MTAAGVQNLEPAAYLPVSPSTPTPDARGISGADTKDVHTQGAASDFQSELQRHDTGSQETKPAPDHKGDHRKESGKFEKKRSTPPEDFNLSAAPPVQVAESQKQILPFVLNLGKPDEQAASDGNSPEPTPDTGRQAEPGLQSSIAPAIERTQLPRSTPQPVKLPAARLRQSVQASIQAGEALPDLASTRNAAPPATNDLSNAQIQTSAPVLTSENLAKDDSAIWAKPETSAGSQPASQFELPMPAAAPEQVAPAIQEQEKDSAASGPAALAFAARLGAVSRKEASPKTATSVPENPSPGSAGPAVQRDRIPVRYAATAQILQNAALGVKDEDRLSKDPVPSLDRSFRTDIVTRIETPRDAAPNSSPAAPPQPASSARTEHVIEPPAAPPTSPHDIRVRVPDNNGGSTQVRFVESGGEVRVSVRSTDEGLAQNLRTHLNDLTQRLADGGISAEMWKPASTGASSQNNQHQPDRDGRGSAGQGSGGQGSGSHGGHEDRREKQPAWLEEMETSLHGSGN